MKYLFYLILVLLLVPLQTTLLPHLSVWNIKPDLGLVAAALVGLFAGELEGLLVGLAIGWVLSLFSAGELWLSLLTNGGVGLLVSLASGLFAAMNFKHLDVSQMWWMVESIVLPQACFDGAVGAGLYWLLSQRFHVTRLRTE